MIGDLREQAKSMSIMALGAHKPILQAILDFDYIVGKEKPSVVAAITTGSKTLKLFYGDKEILIPCYASVEAAKHEVEHVDFMLNLKSGRRTFDSTTDFFAHYPDAIGSHMFAEDVPEIHANKLYKQLVQDAGKFLIGPAGVGLIIPGSIKLGAIGGTDYRQILTSGLQNPGSVAVLSASGGMTNELIRIVANHGKGVSFSMCFGGDRFPSTTPREAFIMAQEDPRTEAIVYYGELGGTDEYELVDMIKDGTITKPVVAFIAGTVGESFEQPVQFGHAKALAQNRDETASAKKEALAEVGVTVAGSIKELVSHIDNLEVSPKQSANFDTGVLDGRKNSIFSSTISDETPDGYEFAGRSLTAWAQSGNFITQAVTGILGHDPKSEEIVQLTRKIFLVSIDHGPQVSGALNTIVTARAGKNLVDSLAAGLLTIGPRFGGAVSGAAAAWHDGISRGVSPKEFIEEKAAKGEYIPGIGHKKYRIDNPDPRNQVLLEFIDKLDKNHRHLDFARGVGEITSAKNANLILNIDGHIAALLLDVLEQKEGYTHAQLQQLIEIDFFNAFFVIPRTIGFVSHYLDQKRNDEGLFRLPDDFISFQ